MFAFVSGQLIELIVKPDKRDNTTVLSRAFDSRDHVLLKSVLEVVQGCFVSTSELEHMVRLTPRSFLEETCVPKC